MAIVKRGSTASAPGYPAAFVGLVEAAATAYVTHKWFEEKYNAVKGSIQAYLESPTCPVTVRVGQRGGNPRIDGVGLVVVSQPERIDNQAAIAEVVALLKSGTIRPDDLVGIISTVNKANLGKVTDVSPFLRKNEDGEAPLELSVRVDATFRDAVREALTENVGKKIAA